MPATAQDKLVVSVWGGSWRDMVAEIIGKKFTAQTGVPVEYITGERDKDAVRTFARAHLTQPVASLEQLVQAWSA